MVKHDRKLFSKMTKQILKEIRVNSKEELSQHIYRYFDEINADPIVYHWTYKIDEFDPGNTLPYVIIPTPLHPNKAASCSCVSPTVMSHNKHLIPRNFAASKRRCPSHT